jgi:hypothetical protein
MVLSMRAHTVVASAQRPRPRRVQAPQRSISLKSQKLGTSKLRHQAPRGPLVAPVRYTSVPERQGEWHELEICHRCSGRTTTWTHPERASCTCTCTITVFS